MMIKDQHDAYFTIIGKKNSQNMYVLTIIQVCVNNHTSGIYIKKIIKYSNITLQTKSIDE